ncbi:MAG TPA: NAD(P)/FAD-dependent oxidoreductase [Methylomusa anaerophila]|uniref:Dihydrolipoamide dehydrogenase n=1 Tax=Methylomusa anaerophila TaxID=1930071 RepID=A0A348AHS5_9FIRM|nr:NAD(P)/FAD-dependent oxidoreductase [Methylomusa anaerophila]BBB90623.1 dihydrolipoamide dehydrogenase [Methylomusa anaerophila]HML88770.1 NAD(P)/FAD-dependent oxidoreductase [Methylomusa anaerophila]
MKQYDVIVIGAGPAGIFTALELADKGLEILVLEKGRDIRKRHCYSSSEKSTCINCKPCDIVCGWGGAGAFSDGKLTLTTEFGGILDAYMEKTKVAELIEYIDGIYLKFGATTTVYGGEHKEEIRKLQRIAAAADLSFIPARIRHLGTEKCLEILTRMRDYLEDKCEIRTMTPVEHILVKDGKYEGVELVNGEIVRSKYLVVAPGREGSEWFAAQAAQLGLSMVTNPVDIGVRVELPATIMEHITETVYESKLVYYTKSFDDRIRTFCMNPYGVVSTENNSGLVTVNGHSYAEKRTQNTNFALLVSKSFTQPFKEPITYGKSIAKLANLLGGGVIVQRLGDLLDGRRSTAERITRGLVEPTLKDATPGDLSLVLPYRHMVAITEMLEALDIVAPGVNSRHTLLYGVEVKFYSSRPNLTNNLETQISNLFAIGDGAGVTRGLAQASAAGVVVAREIQCRTGK